MTKNADITLGMGINERRGIRGRDEGIGIKDDRCGRRDEVCMRRYVGEGEGRGIEDMG